MRLQSLIISLLIRFWECEENIGDTPENKQYVEGIKAIIDHGNGKISAETEKIISGACIDADSTGL